MKDKGFENYELSDELLKSIAMLGYKSLTNVQKKVIPELLAHKDIIVKSQTGSGKTAAYAIPICELVEWEDNKPQALVLVPTRELAIQVKEDFFNLGRFKRMKVSALYGKAPFELQEKELKQKTHVVVGTPGRTIDHLERGTLDTSSIKYLVIDEADEMLSMGFLEQLESIINQLPKDRVTVLLSATMAKDIESLCSAYMKSPIFIEIASQSTAVDRILQEGYRVDEDGKLERLKDITIIENPDSCIIFCNTKQRVDEVHKELLSCGYSCEKIHGGMEQRDRLRVMEKFKQGYFRYLIATDVAARGIDIDNISLVVNYDIPQDKEVYVHRIGRTGRRDREGKAITLISEADDRYLRDITKYIGKELTIKEKPDSSQASGFKKAFLEKMRTSALVKEAKGAPLNQEIMKLHINAGKKTKMRAVDIVGTLCNIDGITKDDIGIINILDISTYVEILNNKGELAFQELQKINIKGRPRRVSKVDQ